MPLNTYITERTATAERLTVNRDGLLAFLDAQMADGRLPKVRWLVLTNLAEMIDRGGAFTLLRSCGHLWQPLQAFPPAMYGFFKLDGFAVTPIGFEGDMDRVIHALGQTGVPFLAVDAAMSDDTDFNGVVVREDHAEIALGIITLIAKWVLPRSPLWV